MLPHAMLAFTSPSSAPAWAEPAFEGRRGYIRCTEDQCLPATLQDSFVESSGVTWDVRDVKASHSAFISQGEEVARLAIEFARHWVTLKTET